MTRRELIAGLLLTLATLVVYQQVSQFGFVQIDDSEFVLDNAAIHDGLSWSSVQWAFTTHQANIYHPVTWLSFIIDVDLYNFEPHAPKAAGFHLTSMLLHALASGVLLIALSRLTGSLPRSAIVAGLFALHPMHVESVAWISERKDVLSGLFFAITLWAYACYVRRCSVWMYLLVAVSFTLGLLSKPMLVTVPAVLLLLDFWPLGRVRRWTVAAVTIDASPQRSLTFLMIEKLPLLAMSIAMSILAYTTQQAGGALQTIERYPLDVRLLNVPVAYARYLRKTFWPSDLAVFYVHPGYWPAWMVGVSLAAIVVITLWCIWMMKRRSYLLVGWLWFVGMFVPVIGLVQVGSFSMADRYVCLPHIGLFVALVWLAADFLQHVPGRRIVAPVFAAMVLLAAAGLTYNQLQTWRDSESLFLHAIRVASPNPPAHYGLGLHYLEKRKNDLAFEQFAAAARLNTGYAEAHVGKAAALARMNKIDEAISELKISLNLRETNNVAHFNLAGLYLSRNEFDAAIVHLRRAIQLRPDDYQAQFALARTLSQTGGTAEAITIYFDQLRQFPDGTATLNELAWIFATHPDARYRNGERAVEMAERLNRLMDHKYPLALRTLAAAYAEAGRFDDAVRTADLAIEKAGPMIESFVEAVQMQRAQYAAGNAYRDSTLK